MTRSLQVLVLLAFLPRCPAPPWSSSAITWCKDTPCWHVLHPVPLGPCQWCHPPWTWQYLGFCRALFLPGGDGGLGCAPVCAWVLQSHLSRGVLGWQRCLWSARCRSLSLQQWLLTVVLLEEFPLWKGINAGMPEDTGTVWWLHILVCLDLKWLILYLGLW